MSYNILSIHTFDYKSLFGYSFLIYDKNPKIISLLWQWNFYFKACTIYAILRRWNIDEK